MNPNSRMMLLQIAISTFCISCASNVKDVETDESMKLWYDEPAAVWEEALPLGNGRLGAMVYGGVDKEQIDLNEESVWAGGPNTNANPDAKAALPVIRKYIFEGKYYEAQKLADEKIISHTNHGMAYLPVGSLFLSFPISGEVQDYTRDLDLSKAVSSTNYTMDGVTYSRETFVSLTDQVIVMRLTASKKGHVSFDGWLESPQDCEISVSDDGLVLKGKAPEMEGEKGKIAFTALMKVKAEKGSISSSDSKISVKDADAATIFISIATNFVNYKDVSGDPDARSSEYMSKAFAKSYNTLRKDHIARYSEYFDRVGFELERTEASKRPTNDRIRDYANGEDPQLAALYFQFGRYLLISSSQPGTQPATLQGIWNNKMSPPWDSKYTTNINAEMNYWPAEVANLSELHEPLLKMIKELSVVGRETAQTMYGAQGWVLHHNTDLWRTTGAVDLAMCGMWPSGQAWLSRHLWEHFLYSGDMDYLKKAYPVMKQAALFYLDFAVEEPEHKWMVISPSISPEHAFTSKNSNSVSVTAGVTMDNQLMYELYSNVIWASEFLQADKEFADTLRQAINRVPPMQIGRYGQLQEWLQDLDDPEDHHRHVSHLYGLFPSAQISPFRSPELFQAARTSLEQRGDVSTGWSMGWKVCLWARLLDGNRAYNLLTNQLHLIDNYEKQSGGTYPNMFDVHPPFQIDGNFGCAAGIAEMLLQSHDGAVHVLPALPDAWKSGKIRGLKARGGFDVSIEWADGTVAKVWVHSNLGGNLRLRSSSQLKAENDAFEINKASGINPNPYFKVYNIPKPIISSEAPQVRPEVPSVYEYDVSTEKGRDYVFTIFGQS